MKNIHVLPTDKPSRLAYYQESTSYNKPVLQLVSATSSDYKYQNIYITSDEEIKEGDWYVNTLDEVVRKNNTVNHSYHKKIILTTDGDLIKDGVQAIDDEFLQWFVENPSCEEVEVSEDYFKPSNMVYGHDTEPYKIIIPKEETKLKNICIKCGVDLYATEGRFECQKHPKECKGIYLSKETLLIHAAEQKQHLTDMMKADEELGLYEEPKQETTLEEAAEKYVKNFAPSVKSAREIGFIDGAKYQAKRMYSEEEVLDLLKKFYQDDNNFNGTIKEWFEQFKKK